MKKIPALYPGKPLSRIPALMACLIASGLGTGYARPLQPAAQTAAEPTTKPIAKVGKEIIGQTQWQAYLKGNSDLIAGEALDRLIRREVAWRKAQELGLLQGDEWQDFLKGSRRAFLAKAYLDAQPGHMAMTEAQAKAIFLSQGEERRVSHVLCKTRKVAESALKRLKRGESMEKVAAALSKDPSAAKNQGDLGWIKRGQMVKPFAEAVYSAKVGALVGPFKSEFGWHVALVKEVRAPQEEEFTKNKAAIIQKLEEAHGKPARDAALAALRLDYPRVEDKAILDRDRTTMPARGDETRVAGRVAGSEISLKELKQFLAEYLGVGGATHSLGADTKGRLMEILADDYRLALAAEKMGVDKRPEVQAVLWDAQRQGAFAAFAKTYLERVEVPEAELKNHHEKFPDRFLGLGAVRLHLLVMDAPEFAQSALDEARKGTPWEKLFDQFANKAATGDWNPGWVEMASLRAALPENALQALRKVQLGYPIGPVQGPDGYLVMEVLERRPGSLLPFPECLAAVKQDYLKERGSEMVDRYLDTEGRKGLDIQKFPQSAN